MGELFQRVRQQIVDFYQSLDRNRRILIFGGGGVAVIILTVAILLFTRVEYVPVATGVDLGKAAEITAKLTELGISYRDADNTTTILVPKADLSRAKMELTVSNVFTDKDFTWTEAFASNSITLTSEDREAMHRLAKQTALEQTIETLEAVDRAKVNLEIPSDSAFVFNNDAQSRASVALSLKNGYKMNESQVDGVVMLVVNSVRGLEPKNVTVIDRTGVQLNSNQGSEEQFTASSQLEMKMAVESKLQNDLQAFLGTVFGMDGVRVMTSVVLDFDTQITTSKVFTPPIADNANGIVRSMTEITENVVNAAATGVPGTDTNLEAPNTTGQSDSQSNYQKASKTVNYEMNETLTQLEKAKGAIQDITVSVIINQSKLANETLTETQRKDIVDLVSAAAGLDTRVVQVYAQTFAVATDPFGEEETGGTTLPLWLVGILIAAVLVGAVVAIVVVRRRTRVEEEERLIREMEEQKELDEIRLDEADKASPKYQIEKFIETNPEVVAQLLRAWLNED